MATIYSKENILYCQYADGTTTELSTLKNYIMEDIKIEDVDFVDFPLDLVTLNFDLQAIGHLYCPLLEVIEGDTYIKNVTKMDFPLLYKTIGNLYVRKIEELHLPALLEANTIIVEGDIKINLPQMRSHTDIYALESSEINTPSKGRVFCTSKCTHLNCPNATIIKDDTITCINKRIYKIQSTEQLDDLTTYLICMNYDDPSDIIHALEYNNTINVYGATLQEAQELLDQRKKEEQQ